MCEGWFGLVWLIWLLLVLLVMLGLLVVGLIMFLACPSGGRLVGLWVVKLLSMVGLNMI